MTISRLDILIERFHDQTISEEEHAELLNLLSQAAHARKARRFFKEIMERQPDAALYFSETESRQLLASIHTAIKTNKQTARVRTMPVLKWAGVAAAACMLLVMGYWLLQPARKTEKPVVQQTPPTPADLAPGKKNKAVLILADNTQIELDSAGSGMLGMQGNARITKAPDGEIVYESGADLHTTSVTVYNTLEIPIGGEYQLTLSDGSKVWLNAASRLKFPVSFSGNTREVELSGEAYFEIAKNKDKPFKVHFNRNTVEVLGTHFNVNAYENENRQAVTLLEGAVKVSNTLDAIRISPGQQAILAATDPIHVKRVDTEEAVAWKNGYFMFVNEDIKSIMRKLSRWYGFTAEYQGEVNEERFDGMISRFRNISEVLKMFESTGTIRFNIIPGNISGKGNTIIVTK